MTSMLKRFFADDVVAQIHRAPGECVSVPERFNCWPSLLQAQYLEAKYLLPGYILSSQGDRKAVAHSVEGRFPFLDHRVVEFASRIPPRLKLKALNEKYILKRAVRDLVPKTVLNRKKQPYRAPTQCFLNGPHSDYVEELLQEDRVRRDGVFDPNAVSALVSKFKAKRAVGAKDEMALTGILTTEILMQQFVNDFTREIHGKQDRENTTVHC